MKAGSREWGCYSFSGKKAVWADENVQGMERAMIIQQWKFT